MSRHRYAVGESVSYIQRNSLFAKVAGEYDVTRLVPNDDQSDDPQYRLKSRNETHERIARESELRAASAQPGDRR